ncbi:hypothetical protein COU13_00070 [Candidatus Kaiserbacteria bacterium CG10_big_fil_rev_8_21_14_0_10_43_70]|uniref:Uncharacterized protein n=1 Tax=Candidatus Kaiserbacteria bacterium CG10_big_fil_rev_8_21_14_0_10_43_70 TaxID=1974605 RepID=A0A2H0UJK8_9BACT|nr:MAG: hypothetical protein COU13_00070 [Candidatus Kaiserbacteria bacterium CG10_big_fil_rev_8_21_14_0_10_43_70]
MNEKEKDIGILGSFFLIASAIAVDSLQFLLTWIPAIGLALNTAISFFAAITFIIWLSYWNVSFLDAKYALRGFSGLIAEIIPIISSFPVWSAVIISIIVANRFRKKRDSSDV